VRLVLFINMYPYGFLSTGLVPARVRKLLHLELFKALPPDLTMNFQQITYTPVGFVPQFKIKF
jgi:hypothetical protein